MASDYLSVDISDAPDLARVAEAVQSTGKPHALKRGDETIAIVRPVPRKKDSGTRRRRQGLAHEDSLWNIVGMFEDPDGPTDVS